MNLETLKKRKFEAGVALFLIICLGFAAYISSTGFTGSAQANDYVRVQTSDITGGSAFEQGTKLNIDYAIETNVGGTLEFYIDGQKVATQQPYTGSEQTYTYRWETSDVSLGEHNYMARFVSTDGKEYTTERKYLDIVNETEDNSGGETVIIKKEGQKIYDNLIEFREQRYTPNWGYSTEKDFAIVNHRDKETFVTLNVPNKPGCQYIEIQTNHGERRESPKYGDRAIYELPPVSTDPSKSAVSIKPLMKISAPTQEQFEKTGMDLPITCQLETENENAGEFFVEIRPTNNPVLKAYNSITTSLSSEGESGINVAGVQVQPLTFVVWAIILLVVIGLGAAYVKNQVMT